MSGDTEARPNDARPAFVSPRTLLEQVRPILPPRSFTALDREQLDGLVLSRNQRCAVLRCAALCCAMLRCTYQGLRVMTA